MAPIIAAAANATAPISSPWLGDGLIDGLIDEIIHFFRNIERKYYFYAFAGIACFLVILAIFLCVYDCIRRCNDRKRNRLWELENQPRVPRFFPGLGEEIVEPWRIQSRVRFCKVLGLKPFSGRSHIESPEFLLWRRTGHGRSAPDVMDSEGEEEARIDWSDHPPPFYVYAEGEQPRIHARNEEIRAKKQAAAGKGKETVNSKKADEMTPLLQRQENAKRLSGTAESSTMNGEAQPKKKSLLQAARGLSEMTTSSQYREVEPKRSLLQAARNLAEAGPSSSSTHLAFGKHLPEYIKEARANLQQHPPQETTQEASKKSGILKSTTTTNSSSSQATKSLEALLSSSKRVAIAEQAPPSKTRSKMSATNSSKPNGNKPNGKGKARQTSMSATTDPVKKASTGGGWWASIFRWGASKPTGPQPVTSKKYPMTTRDQVTGKWEGDFDIEGYMDENGEPRVWQSRRRGEAVPANSLPVRKRVGGGESKSGYEGLSKNQAKGIMGVLDINSDQKWPENPHASAKSLDEGQFTRRYATPPGKKVVMNGMTRNFPSATYVGSGSGLARATGEVGDAYRQVSESSEASQAVGNGIANGNAAPASRSAHESLQANASSSRSAEASSSRFAEASSSRSAEASSSRAGKVSSSRSRIPTAGIPRFFSSRPPSSPAKGSSSHARDHSVDSTTSSASSASTITQGKYLNSIKTNGASQGQMQSISEAPGKAGAAKAGGSNGKGTEGAPLMAQPNGRVKYGSLDDAIKGVKGGAKK